MNALDAYLAAKDIQNAAFAGRLRVSEATISRLRRGKQRPSLDLALKIERETEGVVSPAALFAAFAAPAPPQSEAA